MRITLDDPTVVPDLLDYLRAKSHVVADQVGPAELEVSLLGSRNLAARRLELDLMIEAWRAAHRQSARVIAIE